MRAERHISRRDLERLSAYLDEQLSPRERSALEARLEQDEFLRRELEALRRTVGMLRRLPEIRLPRSFTLTPEMARLRARPAAYPALRLATVLAALAFVSLIGVESLMRSSLRTAMPAASEVMVEVERLAEPPQEPGEEMAMGIAAADQGTLTPAIEQQPFAPEAFQATEAGAEAAKVPEALGTPLPDEGYASPPCEPCPPESATEPSQGQMAQRQADSLDEPVSPPDVEGETLSAPWLNLQTLRRAEIGLGVLVLILIGITIWARSRT